MDSYGLNTLGPKPNLRGTTTVASTHGKVGPALATDRGTQSVSPGAFANTRGKQDPELAGSESADDAYSS